MPSASTGACPAASGQSGARPSEPWLHARIFRKELVCEAPGVPTQPLWAVVLGGLALQDPTCAQWTKRACPRESDRSLSMTAGTGRQACNARLTSCCRGRLLTCVVTSPFASAGWTVGVITFDHFSLLRVPRVSRQRSSATRGAKLLRLIPAAARRGREGSSPVRCEHGAELQLCLPGLQAVVHRGLDQALRLGVATWSRKRFESRRRRRSCDIA